ncbi:MAG: hypothetical protein RLZZ29_656 [Cyanobacteriota bacterium]
MGITVAAISSPTTQAVELLLFLLVCAAVANVPSTGWFLSPPVVQDQVHQKALLPGDRAH